MVMYVYEDINNFDYIYNARDLITLRGKSSIGKEIIIISLLEVIVMKLRI